MTEHLILYQCALTHCWYLPEIFLKDHCWIPADVYEVPIVDLPSPRSLPDPQREDLVGIVWGQGEHRYYLAYPMLEENEEAPSLVYRFWHSC